MSVQSELPIHVCEIAPSNRQLARDRRFETKALAVAMAGEFVGTTLVRIDRCTLKHAR